ncbi:hypothetical protein PFICI_02989 [Pestalotiopsis fici W106-1]|uniref:SGNH hydrolase-type esterase domain-containing protein n=1 Tax=Pestalotiopsis fici (strain W106-1 / CGMCC3.15140) TaxID=1229662 RepID=W3XG28_PESFW|nr:uncharacterized protein PFICI_02989 [Pestalotiopsis fici W106-1]ETS84964.1 hypothetical protein PFICI_02989 [Pestalotiopsis fici W106-1]
MRGFFTCLSVLPALLNLAAGISIKRASKDPYFLLIGDSTVAVNGGWGDGFLSYLRNGAEGENRGKSGSTTASWKANGRWADLLTTVADEKDAKEPIVTIQFGHNDQKSLTLDEYRANLVNITTTLKEAGATPIIITPLTRRNFDGDEVQQDFVEWRGKAIAVAKEVGIKWLDLTQASTNYINAIGAENASYYDLSEGDGTHLNTAGQTVFGRMVADLLLEKRTDLSTFFTPNEALSDKISAGEFATGDE